MPVGLDLVIKYTVMAVTAIHLDPGPTGALTTRPATPVRGRGAGGADWAAGS